MFSTNKFNTRVRQYTNQYKFIQIIRKKYDEDPNPIMIILTKFTKDDMEENEDIFNTIKLFKDRDSQKNLYDYDVMYELIIYPDNHIDDKEIYTCRIKLSQNEEIYSNLTQLNYLLDKNKRDVDQPSLYKLVISNPLYTNNYPSKIIHQSRSRTHLYTRVLSSENGFKLFFMHIKKNMSDASEFFINRKIDPFFNIFSGFMRDESTDTIYVRFTFWPNSKASFKLIGYPSEYESQNSKYKFIKIFGEAMRLYCDEEYENFEPIGGPGADTSV